jgi:DNA-binding NarL/FixJ family response regulator
MPSLADPIKILLVDDHILFRSGLRALLSDVAGFSIVSEAANASEAAEQIDQIAPDVVVLGLDLRHDAAAETARITSTKRRPSLLALTTSTEEDGLISLLLAGASGFLTREAGVDDLVNAIRALAGGDMYVRPESAGILAARIRPHHHDTPAEAARAQMSKLSEREREVLRHFAEGYNGPEIGSRIGISSKTVETYKQRIAEKIGLGHRAEYVRFALTAGLIGSSPRE